MPPQGLMMIIVGGDALALSTARELCLVPGHRVVVLWPEDAEFARAVAAVGAAFVAGRPDSRDGLEAAGVAEAVSILALSRDDQLNLQAALRARDANPRIRIVLRQFNRTLAAKIEQNLANCSVLSLAWHSAATYAAVALDPSCFRGLQFPEPDGPLTGFAMRLAEDDRLAGHNVVRAEQTLGARIVAIDGITEIAPEETIPAGARLVCYGPLDRLLASASRRVPAESRPSLARRLRGLLRHDHRRRRRPYRQRGHRPAARIRLPACRRRAEPGCGAGRTGARPRLRSVDRRCEPRRHPRFVQPRRGAQPDRADQFRHLEPRNRARRARPQPVAADRLAHCRGGLRRIDRAPFRLQDDLFGRRLGRSGLRRAGAPAGGARPHRLRRSGIRDRRN